MFLSIKVAVGDSARFTVQWIALLPESGPCEIFHVIKDCDYRS